MVRQVMEAVFRRVGRMSMGERTAALTLLRGERKSVPMRTTGPTLAFVLLVLGACRPDPPEEVPPPATRAIRVRVVDGSGAPVATEGVLVWWGEGEDAEFGKAVGVDEGGVVVIEDAPGGPVVLCALTGGFVVPSKGWPRKVVPPGVTATDLVLDVGADRTIRVLGWNEGASGTAYLAAVEDLEPSQHGVEDDGTVRIEGLRPGVAYNLYVREFETGRCALLRGLPAEEPWPEIELAPGRDVTGRIRYPEGCDYQNVAILVDRAVMIDGSVAADGSFRIKCVPDGTWTVVAYTNLDGRYLAATKDVRAGESVTLDLTK
jgi:hypothetical protein